MKLYTILVTLFLLAPALSAQDTPSVSTVTFDAYRTSVTVIHTQHGPILVTSPSTGIAPSPFDDVIVTQWDSPGTKITVSTVRGKDVSSFDWVQAHLATQSIVEEEYPLS